MRMTSRSETVFVDKKRLRLMSVLMASVRLLAVDHQTCAKRYHLLVLEAIFVDNHGLRQLTVTAGVS